MRTPMCLSSNSVSLLNSINECDRGKIFCILNVKEDLILYNSNTNKKWYAEFVLWVNKQYY